MIETLTAHLTREGWTVERRLLRCGMSGYADPAARTVVLAAEHEAKTLIHECAHIAVEHVADLNEYAQHRGLMETEAESVAYAVAGIVGFDTSAYSVGYIAGWSNADLPVIKLTASRVLAAAHLLAEILDPTDPTPEQADQVTAGCSARAAGLRAGREGRTPRVPPWFPVPGARLRSRGGDERRPDWGRFATLSCRGFLTCHLRQGRASLPVLLLDVDEVPGFVAGDGDAACAGAAGLPFTSM